MLIFLGSHILLYLQIVSYNVVDMDTTTPEQGGGETCPPSSKRRKE